MTVSARPIAAPPSLATLAGEAIRGMIMSGELRPGDRIVENRLTVELGISRPPLREALRVLEQEGLVVSIPRRGTVVRPITLHDVYEIFTLREELEQLAVNLGVPVRDPKRLERCREALARLEAAAEADDRALVTERGFDFHLAVVGLAGHRRLEDAYRALALQMRLCMGMNRHARRQRETLAGDAARHRHILDLVEAGDTEATGHALIHHGHRTFVLDFGDTFEGHSPESEAWLAQVRTEETEA